jgi:hypothetical protein
VGFENVQAKRMRRHTWEHRQPPLLYHSPIYVDPWETGKKKQVLSVVSESHRFNGLWNSIKISSIDRIS